MIALAGKGPARYPMGDYWQAIAYRKARPRRGSESGIEQRAAYGLVVGCSCVRSAAYCSRAA